LHVETPSLDRLGRVFGQNDLKGAAIVDATVTGNGQELKASGMLDGSNLGIGENTALDLDSMFDVDAAAVEARRCHVHAKTNATFLQVGGQQVNELTRIRPTRSRSSISTPRPSRACGSSRARVPQCCTPITARVHVGSLALQSENVVWKTDPASHPTIQYGNNRRRRRRHQAGERRSAHRGAGRIGPPTRRCT
jgi:hypothetical protein